MMDREAKKSCKKMRKLKKRIGQERMEFRLEMLSETKNHIYDSFEKIRFYEVVNEYFQECRQIPEDILEMPERYGGILEGLWETYLKYEDLHIDSWEQVEEVLEGYVCEEWIHHERKVTR